jgi:hypothetical protein
MQTCLLRATLFLPVNFESTFTIFGNLTRAQRLLRGVRAGTWAAVEIDET